MIEPEEITRRVLEGATLLSRHYLSAEWAHKIDPDSLDMQDECGCVLGQVFGGFNIGMQLLRLDEADAAEHGFESTIALHGRVLDEDSYQEYVQLRDEWIGLVDELLERVR